MEFTINKPECWNWYTFKSQKLEPKGLRVRISPLALFINKLKYAGSNPVWSIRGVIMDLLDKLPLTQTAGSTPERLAI